MYWYLILLLAISLSAIAFEPQQPTAIETVTADTVFVGGDVITLNTAQPLAKAVAIRNGTIVYVGDQPGSQPFIGKTTQVVDLKGQSLVPGFIDTHGHISVSALTQSMIDISAARVKSLTQLKQVLLKDAPSAADNWILGYGYDESLWPEQRHPTRYDLDRVSTKQPILLIHNSMHIFAANSKALALAGIDARTQDPFGGKFLRVAGGREPNGVIEELSAANRVLALAPMPSAQELIDNLYQTQLYYASLGVTTAQEGAATLREMQLLTTAANSGKLILDMTVLPYWHTIDQALAHGMGPVGVYRNKLKIAGIKIGLDGAMSAKTAFMIEPYAIPPKGKAQDYRGYLQLSKEDIFAQFDRIYRQGWQINAHVAGDAAAQIMVDALQTALEKHGPRDHRAVMIHAISLRPTEMDRMATMGGIPSFYSYHLCSWGDGYINMLGRDRAAKLVPAKWAAKRHMRFTLHTDAPISSIDPLALMACNMRRQTPSGEVLGADQRLTAMEALKALTLDAAYQYYEEGQKGSIETGKLADLVVLSHNPLELAIEQWDQMTVRATYKDGRQIYRAHN